MARNPNKTAKVWRAIKEEDVDQNGFLGTDELELCFREHFAYELDGRSMVYYFRRFSTDHDKDLINYRQVKQELMRGMKDHGIGESPMQSSRPSLMQKSNTSMDLRIKASNKHSALQSFLNSKENTAKKPMRASHAILAQASKQENDNSRNVDIGNSLPNLYT
jgi:hypothetical protein